MSLLYLPYYVVWKTLIWFHGKPTNWARTKREVPPGPRLAARNPAENVPQSANY